MFIILFFAVPFCVFLYDSVNIRYLTFLCFIIFPLVLNILYIVFMLLFVWCVWCGVVCFVWCVWCGVVFFILGDGMVMGSLIDSSLPIIATM